RADNSGDGLPSGGGGIAIRGNEDCHESPPNSSCVRLVRFYAVRQPDRLLQRGGALRDRSNKENAQTYGRKSAASGETTELERHHTKRQAKELRHYRLGLAAQWTHLWR